MTFRSAAFEFKVRLVGGRAYSHFIAASRAADSADAAKVLHQQTQDAVRMARYASERSPWYAARLRGLIGENLADRSIWEQIPILEKEDLREHYDELLAVGSGVKRTAVAATGGSTGMPLHVLKDFTVRPATLTWRLLNWWGVHPSDNSASIERLPWHGWRHHANEALWWPTRKLNVDAGAMSPEDMKHFALALRRVRPKMLWGYAHALHAFALETERNGWGVPALTAISSSAAPLTAVQAADVERIVGAPVYETYRSAELSLIAGHCERREGMHIQADHKLLEVVDDAGRRVPDGESGEIVVTDLLNRAQPLLRYRLGDVGVIDPEPCPCGRPFPRLRALLGRSNDVIRTPSGAVSAYSFASAFAEHPGVRQYQIHQMADYSLRVKIVPSSAAVTFESLAPALAHLAQEFDDALPVSAEIVDEIPHVRGKQKSVVSHIDSESSGS